MKFFETTRTILQITRQQNHLRVKFLINRKQPKEFIITKPQIKIYFE